MSADPRDLAAFYAEGYTVPDAAEAQRLGRWRALGAESKCKHVVALAGRAGLRPRSVVEIGCGDGALLEALARARVAERLDGFEISEPAARIAQTRGIPGAGRVEAYDGRRVPAGDGTYDLAVLSHVLEHVPDPAGLLGEAARVAEHVLVEVPLEANRSASRPAKRAEAARIGHIQTFDRDAVRALAARNGLRVLGELTDALPRRHHVFFADGTAARARATAKWAVRAGAHALAPLRAERLFTVHYAALLAPGGAPE